MKKIDEDMPIGKLKKVKDLLPPPNRLIVQEKTVKVTIRLNEKDLTFFKKEARKNHTKYQKLIRSVIDKYVELYA